MTLNVVKKGAKKEIAPKDTEAIVCLATIFY